VPVIDHRDAANPESLSPEESLRLIERTRAETMRAFGWSYWGAYLAWGIVWLVCFGLTQLIAGTPDAPLASWGLGSLGYVWPVGVTVGVLAMAFLVGRQSRGLDGSATRMGRRMTVGWGAAITTTAVLSNRLGLADNFEGVLFVLVVALLYIGTGAVIGDDVQLWLGVWFLFTIIVAVALGPSAANGVFAVLGGGALLVGAAFDRFHMNRATPGDG
jgi:hypothetical protein